MGSTLGMAGIGKMKPSSIHTYLTNQSLGKSILCSFSKQNATTKLLLNEADEQHDIENLKR